MKKILITGTAGFIGFHLGEKLLKEGGWDILGLDNINDYYDINLKYARLAESGFKKEYIDYNKIVLSEKSSNYRFIKLDLRDQKNILNLFEQEKFDYVVNLAAQAGVRYSLSNPHEYIQSNIVGFMNILEACRHNDIKHLIYASSSSVYGANSKIPFSTSDNVDHPISLYAATKKSNELMAYTYSHLFNLPTTGLRFFTVYGPWGRPDMALFIFTRAILNYEPIDVFNFGNMSRDFTYIDDITESVFRIIIKSPEQNIYEPIGTTPKYTLYNIGSNSPTNLMDFIKIIEEKLNVKANIHYKPLQPGDVEKTWADVTELFDVIKFKPNTNLRDGIESFIDWYLEYFK